MMTKLVLLFSFVAPFANAQTTCPVGQVWSTSMGMCMPIPAPTTFRGISRNIFLTTCITCHASHDGDPAEAKIELTNYAVMMTCNQMTGTTHAPFIIPGDPEHSKLYIAVQTGKMPTTESGAPGQSLTASQIQNIYDWIKAGALNN